MRRVNRYLSIIIMVFASGCGPIEDPDGGPGNGGDGGGGADAEQQGTASVRGVVWAPGQAPGQVPAGHEIPIYDALVVLSLNKQAPIPQETYCEPCINPSGTYTFSDHQGNFSIVGVLPNTYWLTIQKGQFRLEKQIVLDENQVIDLSADMTTLPSRHDPANGMWIPRIAMAVGLYDPLEDVLGKMLLGEVDGTGRYVPASADGVIDVYTNGRSFSGVVSGDLYELVGDLNRLLQYHILFIPCSNDNLTSALYNQSNLRNIRDFVAAGGKLYVTDWSGEWADNVFPAQITLGGGVDTPASAYDPASDFWTTGLFGNADGASYDSENAEITDPDLAAWLSTQSGPIVDGYNLTEPYDPQNFAVEGNWNYIDALNEVYLGEDQGMPVYDTPKAYIIGGQGTSTPKRPLTVTYQPAGCGRVLYSTYHTTDSVHRGLVPQERVLLYLLMEIGVCLSGPIIE